MDIVESITTRRYSMWSVVWPWSVGRLKLGVVNQAPLLAGPECTSRDERLGPKMREAEDGRYKQPANFAACIVNVNKE